MEADILFASLCADVGIFQDDPAIDSDSVDRLYEALTKHGLTSEHLPLVLTSVAAKLGGKILGKGE
jgi:hypothetical protein